jgi:hypothetical protein
MLNNSHFNPNWDSFKSHPKLFAQLELVYSMMVRVNRNGTVAYSSWPYVLIELSSIREQLQSQAYRNVNNYETCGILRSGG